MLKRFTALLIILSTLLIMSCSDSKNRSTGVYMLIDTSGTYTKQLFRAQRIINHLLVNLNVGDSLAVARIDSGSFSEKDIIAKITFDERPSTANKQKLAFKKKIDSFVRNAKGSNYTDITGGILQAQSYLNEVGSGKKVILIFSDLEEELAKGYVRDLSKSKHTLDGFSVIALNVIKLRSDNIDPTKYEERLELWEKRITNKGGKWRLINDLDRPDKILKE